jgi:hypothetical protein
MTCRCSIHAPSRSLQLLFEDLRPSLNTSDEVTFLDHAGTFVQHFVGNVSDVDPARVTGLVFANGTRLPGDDIVLLQLVGLWCMRIDRDAVHCVDM